jgi:hypothetical protein
MVSVKDYNEDQLRALILLHQYAFHEIEESVAAYSGKEIDGKHVYPEWAEKVIELAGYWK